ncbi:MAG: TolC family protein [Candidatus Omnitrophota bacterium]|nr:TolC family protein [Candidatus Omnitrophota bacterium]
MGIFLIIPAFSVSCILANAFGEGVGVKPKEETARLMTICQGIELVLKNNHLIKIALPGNEMAYQDSLIARSALLPNLNLTASQKFSQFQPAAKIGSQNTPTAEKDPFSYGFDVYQTLFDFGKSLSSYRASKDLVEAQKANTESVKRLATLEFITAYFNLLETEKMVAVFEKEVESLSAYLNDIEHLYEQGSAVKNDLLPAKVKLADTKQKLIAARNLREVSGARLNNILALPLRSKIKALDMIMRPPQFPDMDAAWMTAQDLRPEINFYEDQIRASLSTERAKAVENFPVIFLDGGYSYTKNKFQVHPGNASVELGAKMNFYDGGLTRAELLKERSRQKQLVEQKGRLVDDIKLEIEDSYYTLKNSCEKVLVSKDALEQAEENVRFYRVKYSAGSATTTDVLEAITLQTRAQTNYYSADYELKRSYAKLIYSMGIDMQLVYEKMESGKNGA